MDETMKDEIRYVYVQMFLDMHDVWMPHMVKNKEPTCFFCVSVIRSKSEIPSHGFAPCVPHVL